MPSDSELAILTYLDLREKEWNSLAHTNLAYNLRLVIPVLIQIDNKLKDLHWFFMQVQEQDLAHAVSKYAKLIHLYRDGILSNITNEKVSYNELNDALKDAVPVLVKLRKQLISIEHILLSRVKTETKHAGFVQNIKPYWRFLDKVWIRVREVVMDPLINAIKEGVEQIKALLSDIKRIKNQLPQTQNSIDNLKDVHANLLDRLDYRQAEFLDSTIQDLKLHMRCAEGLLPGNMVNGSWHVSIDDCPRLILPKRFTKTTDQFAYCVLANGEDKNKCPGFESSKGSYISCNQLGVEKTAGAFFREVREADQQLKDQIDALALEDPNIQLLKIQSERRDGRYYYAPVIDEKIFILLSSYPKKTRVGTFDYSVYIINNEPILAADDFLLSASEELLKYIDKGDGMPKEATIKTAAVMRLTFTSNARLDPNFRDYMRKLKAVKITDNTWDVPYSREDDIEHIIAELHNDFGYPVQIFELIESPEILTDGRRYDLYAMTCVANVKLVEDDCLDINRPVPNIVGSDALLDVANMLNSKKPMISNRKNRLDILKIAASNMRVGAQFVVATTEEIQENDDFITLTPQVGDRCFVELDNSDIIFAELEEQTDEGWIVRDIDSGESFSGQYGPEIFSGDGYKRGPNNDIVITLSPDALFSVMQALGLGDSLLPDGALEPEDYDEYDDYDDYDEQQEVHMPIDIGGQGIPEQVTVPVVQDQENYIENKKGPGLRILIPELENQHDDSAK